MLFSSFAAMLYPSKHFLILVSCITVSIANNYIAMSIDFV